MTTLSIGDWHPLQRTAARVRAGGSALWWTLVLCCVVGALVGRLAYLARPFDADGAMFIYMGKLTSEGGRLCHDLIDNKFPTVGLVTSVPWRLFGASWAPYVLLGATISFLGCFLLGRIAQRQIGRHAVLPVALFALVYLNFNPAVFGGFQLETIQALFTILAAGAAMEWFGSDRSRGARDARDAFVVGLACACAALLKPTGFAVGAAFALTLIVTHRRDPMRLLAPLGVMLLGVLVPVSVVLLYLIGADLLRDMPQLARQISTYARESAWNWLDLFKPPTVAVILGLPFLVRGWVCRRPEHRVDVKLDGTLLGFLLSWFILETIGVVSQRRMYAYHFLIIVPPAALLFGMIPRRSDVRPLAAALAPILLLSFHGAANVIEYSYRGRSRLPASDYLFAHAQPGDAVWQDEMMRLLIETNLRPGSRVPMSFLFANHDNAPIEYGRMMLADFARTRPKYILLRRDFERWVEHQAKYISELERVPRRRENFIAMWREIRAYVETHYELETMIEREAVWRRRGD